MKNPDQIRKILEEEITKTINEVTEGLLEYSPTVWIEMYDFISSIMESLFGIEEYEDLEEPYADMDQFADEE